MLLELKPRYICQLWHRLHCYFYLRYCHGEDVRAPIRAGAVREEFFRLFLSYPSGLSVSRQISFERGCSNALLGDRLSSHLESLQNQFVAP